MTPSNEHDAAKEGEPVRRWTLRARVIGRNEWNSKIYGERAEAVGPRLKPGGDVEVMPVADHEKAVADLREEIALVSEQRDMIDADHKAALLAARQVDEAKVERGADALMADSGLPRFSPFRNLVERRVRVALLAALNEPEGEQ